ncbi:MAG: helix-turn-helix domain-containing protein [Vallitaleaceae bacterium]|jgi:AraC-like DNA-binding protein|nr:helix-turn-helix domain-containing protein [Vallitaleaceae bacterium]
MEILIKIIIDAGMIVGIFSGIVIIKLSAKKKAHSVFLVVLLMALSFSILHTTYIRSYVESAVGNSRLGYEPTILLFGPLLYLYIPAIHTKAISFKRVMKHAALFFEFFALMVILNVLHKSDISLEVARNIDFCLWAISLLQLGFYIHYIKGKIRVYENNIFEEFSNTTNKSLSWVNYYLYIFMGIVILIITFHSIGIIHNLPISYESFYALIISLSVFIIGYRGITQKPVVLSFEAAHTILTEGDEILTLKIQLEAYMAKNKPYLNSEITLSDLSAKLIMNRNELSSLINQHFGINFSAYINKYRVEEAKELLARTGSLNVLEIGYESGFSSKSSFNAAFKKFTGLTPSEYRKTISI